jgi:hypothetical protein
MTAKESSRRIVIALTETSPVTDLWEAALQATRDTDAEFTVVFLHDERWQRAASLPFTREVSLAGGASSDFTAKRAEQLLAATTAQLRERVEELARVAGLSVGFRVLPETDLLQSRTLLSLDASIVVGPSALAEHPLFVELRSSDLRVVLIGSGERDKD